MTIAEGSGGFVFLKKRDGNANPPGPVEEFGLIGSRSPVDGNALRPIGSQAAGPLSQSLPFPPRAARQGAASGPINRPLKRHSDSVVP